jgi:probable rRNA maturation factor
MRSRSRPQPRLTLAVQNASVSSAVPQRRALRTWAQAALERDATVTLRIVDEAEARRLNREFRRKNYATNVLTFAYEEHEPLSGDLVLCAPVIEDEAQRQGKTTRAHYAHLVVHGILHLQGYDHEHDEDAAVMESRETEIVTKLGYPAPYATA